MKLKRSPHRITQLLGCFVICSASAISAQTNASVLLQMPKAHNPLSAYTPSDAPEPQLTNSPDLNQLIRDGKLYLSLKDAIRLALENNLDIAIARYNLPIADMDILRTKAGGVFRGVNAGVVQGTPGGGVGGFGTGAPGAGAGGTTAGAGGAGAGASGLVQSTLGVGTAVPSYDPPSLRQLEQSIRQPLSRISAFMVYHFCSSTPGRQILVLARPLLLDQAFLSSSTTIVKLPTVLFSIFPPHWVRCTGSLSSSNCSLDLDLAQIFGICESPTTTRRSLISPSKTKSWPQ